MGRLAGKVAIVTGAGAPAHDMSVGGAIAIRFGREGARVGVVDVDPERAGRTVAAIEAAGSEAIPVLADVTDVDACEGAVAAVVDRWGRVDVLVNNVGRIPRRAGIETIDPDEWDAVLALNLRSAMLMARAALPRMGAGGAVVGVGSVLGDQASGVAAYGASKAALAALDREIAVTCGPRGIRANTIAPGFLYTPFVSEGMAPETRERRRRIAPLQVEGNAWDVAAAAVFLASDEARFVSGATLVVDGGVSAASALAAAAYLD
jgi:NAD(P)-dependent dehydrogenase (short-subunit alcohol dehydrogenase family)